jgi:hypothetical protein
MPSHKQYLVLGIGRKSEIEQIFYLIFSAISTICSGVQENFDRRGGYLQCYLSVIYSLIYMHIATSHLSSNVGLPLC